MYQTGPERFEGLFYISSQAQRYAVLWSARSGDRGKRDESPSVSKRRNRRYWSMNQYPGTTTLEVGDKSVEGQRYAISYVIIRARKERDAHLANRHKLVAS
jgi:hypothetical protein